MEGAIHHRVCAFSDFDTEVWSSDVQILIDTGGDCFHSKRMCAISDAEPILLHYQGTLQQNYN